MCEHWRGDVGEVSFGVVPDDAAGLSGSGILGHLFVEAMDTGCELTMDMLRGDLFKVCRDVIGRGFLTVADYACMYHTCFDVVSECLRDGSIGVGKVLKSWRVHSLVFSRVVPYVSKHSAFFTGSSDFFDRMVVFIFGQYEEFEQIFLEALRDAEINYLKWSCRLDTKVV